MDKVTIFERKNEPGVWSVERIDDDGGIEQTIFIGPNAEQRCRDYACEVYQITEPTNVE